MSEGAQPMDGAADPGAAGGSAAGVRRVWPHIAMIAVIVAASVGEAFLWLVWDPPFGESIQNMISYSLIALVAALFLAWLAFYAPFARRTRLVASLLLLLPVVGYAATIRKVEWSGDMRLIVRHRWDPTASERLAAHRHGQPSAEFAPDEIPHIARPEDMPTYRGADARGMVIGPALSQDWEAHPPRQVWRQPCGGGYAQFAVVEPLAVTIEQRGPNEAIVCYETATGREAWVQEYPAEFTEAMGGPGPRATPTIAGEFVYSIGAKGDFLKLRLSDGEVLWRHNILDENNAPNTMWAMSSSPLVLDGLVVVNPGGPKGDGLEAYDVETGRPAWIRDGVKEHAASPDDDNRPGYSTPFLADILGEPQIVMFDGEAVRGYAPETGELLWSHAHRNGPGVNVAQPLVFDDGRLFISCSYDVGCVMLQIERQGDEWTVSPVWENKNLRCKFTSPVLHEGFIYGLDEGILVCLDPATGKRLWKKGRYGHGQLLLTNDQLLVHSEDGRLVLIDPSPEGLREVTSFRTFEEAKNWNPPALVDGRLYVRNHREMACFDLRPAD